MSLDVTFSNGQQRSYHVGSPLPQQNMHNVNRVQADGHELQVIQEQFSSIPMAHRSRVVSWNGEMARFIYEHLRF